MGEDIVEKRSPLTFRSLFHEYKHAWLFWIYLLLGYQFSFTEQIVVPQYWVSCRVDDFIPFIPEFVIPYILWFPAIAFVLITLCFSDRGDFIRCISLLYVGFEAALLLYLVFPNGQPLRPHITDTDFFSVFIRDSIYASDTNTNVCPSIHVLNQLAIHIGLCKSKLGQRHKGWCRVSLVFTVLVCASTVLIKQHSIIDVVAALILEAFLYALIYKINWQKFFNRLRQQRNAFAD